MSALFEVRSISAAYGRQQVLRNVSMTVSAGEIVAVIGHNGSGKSTLLKAAYGLLQPVEGHVFLDGRDMTDAAPSDYRRAGVGYVPQGHRIFRGLSVRENLELALLHTERRGRNIPREAILQRFPRLRTFLARRAGTLSGGEQQQLALACGLSTSPALLLLDEPALGLTVEGATTLFARLHELAASGIALLVVEQRLAQIVGIADRAYVLRQGRVVYDGDAATLRDPARLQAAYL